MNKILIPVICGLALVGCRSTDVTPDQSWKDYGRYYSADPSAAKAIAPAGTNVVAALDVRKVNSRDDQKTVDELKGQGRVLLGKFLIADGTDIDDAAVKALAAKLGAGTVVWSTANAAEKTGLTNPDVTIVGTDTVQMGRIDGNLPNKPFADQVLVHQHEIWMLK